MSTTEMTLKDKVLLTQILRNVADTKLNRTETVIDVLEQPIFIIESSFIYLSLI